MNDIERRLSEVLRDAAPEPPERIVLRRMAARARSQSADTGAVMRRRWATPLLAAVTVGAVVAGALVMTDSIRSARAPEPASTPHRGEAPTPTEGQLASARSLLARWEQAVGGAVYVPIRSPHQVDGYETQRLGSWTDTMGKDRPYVLGLDQRRILPAIQLSTQQPLDGRIVWRDGTTRRTEVLSAKTAFDRFMAGALKCSNCPPNGTIDGITPKPLTLTAAIATTMGQKTTRGDAVVPAWRFSFGETRVQILQAAAIGPSPAPASAARAASMRIESASVALDGRTLTAQLIGAVHPSTQPCGADYFLYAIESSHAVGVVVVERRYERKVACTAMGRNRSATVRLAAPLSNRSVLEMSGGTAVPVNR